VEQPVKGEVVGLRRPGPPLPVRLAISWLTNALVLAIVAGVLSGVDVRNAGSLLAAAAVFGVLNTVLKPLLRFATLPLAILTFGIAWFLRRAADARDHQRDRQFRSRPSR
jgi:membrane protein implicated in regulation of membrane protease activity